MQPVPFWTIRHKLVFIGNNLHRLMYPIFAPPLICALQTQQLQGESKNNPFNFCSVRAHFLKEILHNYINQ